MVSLNLNAEWKQSKSKSTSMVFHRSREAHRGQYKYKKRKVMMKTAYDVVTEIIRQGDKDEPKQGNDAVGHGTEEQEIKRNKQERGDTSFMDGNDGREAMRT
jgi:hypothetical protein